MGFTLKGSRQQNGMGGNEGVSVSLVHVLLALVGFKLVKPVLWRAREFDENLLLDPTQETTTVPALIRCSTSHALWTEDG